MFYLYRLFLLLLVSIFLIFQRFFGPSSILLFLSNAQLSGSIHVVQWYRTNHLFLQWWESHPCLNWQAYHTWWSHPLNVLLLCSNASSCVYDVFCYTQLSLFHCLKSFLKNRSPNYHRCLLNHRQYPAQ